MNKGELEIGKMVHYFPVVDHEENYGCRVASDVFELAGEECVRLDNLPADYGQRYGRHSIAAASIKHLRSQSSVKVGFTGARTGMTKEQSAGVLAKLKELNAGSVIHGGCIGADADFHALAGGLGLHRIVKPGFFKNDPTNLSCRADFADAEEIHSAEPMLPRNREIVKFADVMFATPSHFNTNKGGTWYTIKYARKQGKTVFVWHPDGAVDSP